MRSTRPALSLALLLAVPALASGADRAADRENLRGFLATPLKAALAAYRRIKVARGASCPMLPSDSAYAAQALERHGALWGSLMAADRLHRCSHDLRHYPSVVVGGHIFHADPVEDSWLFR